MKFETGRTKYDCRRQQYSIRAVGRQLWLDSSPQSITDPLLPLNDANAPCFLLNFMLCIVEKKNYNQQESDSQRERERGGERNSGKGVGRRIASCISQPSISYLHASTLSLSFCCVSLIQCAYSFLWRRNSDKLTGSVYLCVRRRGRGHG